MVTTTTTILPDLHETCVKTFGEHQRSFLLGVQILQTQDVWTEKIIAMDITEIRLIDSQDMDYSVRLQKLSRMARSLWSPLQRRNCTSMNSLERNITKSPCWETSKKIRKFLNISWLNQLVNGLVCMRDFFKKMEVITYHLKNNPHMHDQMEMIPEKT